MEGDETILKEVRAALERDRRVNVHRNPIELACMAGVVTMTGELDNVAAKKLALEDAAATSGVSGIVDRLTVKPSEIMQDGRLADAVFNTLVEESAFDDFTILVSGGPADQRFRGTPRVATGSMEAVVENGTVTLNGRVESYAHKALAGVLIWWKPGTRNLVNGLEVEHPLEDPDGEMTDALRMVLEKDRFVNHSQIRAECRDFIVTLKGLVSGPGERDMAEADAWYLFGVNDVVNEIVVLK